MLLSLPCTEEKAGIHEQREGQEDPGQRAFHRERFIRWEILNSVSVEEKGFFRWVKVARQQFPVHMLRPFQRERAFHAHCVASIGTEEAESEGRREGRRRGQLLPI